MNIFRALHPVCSSPIVFFSVISGNVSCRFSTTTTWITSKSRLSNGSNFVKAFRMFSAVEADNDSQDDSIEVIYS